MLESTLTILPNFFFLLFYIKQSGLLYFSIYKWHHWFVFQNAIHCPNAFYSTKKRDVCCNNNWNKLFQLWLGLNFIKVVLVFCLYMGTQLTLQERGPLALTGTITNVPRIITDLEIITDYKYLNSVSCLNNDQTWISGSDTCNNGILRLYSIQREVVMSISCQSQSQPSQGTDHVT